MAYSFYFAFLIACPAHRSCADTDLNGRTLRCQHWALQTSNRRIPYDHDCVYFRAHISPPTHVHHHGLHGITQLNPGSNLPL